MFANTWKNYIPSDPALMCFEQFRGASHFVFFPYLLANFAEEEHLYETRKERRGCFHFALDQRQTRTQTVAH